MTYSPEVRILVGDCLESLRLLPEGSIQCVVTSPPYWGLRDYGVDGQIGLEESMEAFLGRLVEVFREVRRVLSLDGICWVNMGDSYAATLSGSPQTGLKALSDKFSPRKHPRSYHRQADGGIQVSRSRCPDGFRPKNLLGQPWRLAFALQDDGWNLRQDIIWAKPNPMPESVRDRCTRAHEYLFMLTKAERYYWDAEAMMEPVSGSAHARVSKKAASAIESARSTGSNTVASNPDLHGVNPKHAAETRGVASASSLKAALSLPVARRNRRTVWEIGSEPFSGGHFATFPSELPRRCILASTQPGDTVLDPFGGSGTTGMVALELGRSAILCELNPEYAKMARRRCLVTPGLPLHNPISRENSAA